MTSMANKSLRMDQIEKIFQFFNEGMPKKKIARILGISKNTVKKYLNQIEELQSEDKLNSQKDINTPNMGKLIDDRDEVFQKELPQIILELKRVGVTRYLLWEEYKCKYPTGFSYGRFCVRIKQHKLIQSATLKIDHKPGYHLMVDYTGKKISWIDKSTGEVHSCDVLVCTWPYSSYTFAYAVESQKQEDFINAINQAFLFFGGLPKVLLSDNLKSYVTKANRYEPTFTELCIQLSSHYRIELDATRVGKPKDKASVERHVSIIYNRLYAPLRDKEFYSIGEINNSFSEQIEKHNSKKFQRKDYGRKDLFNEEEKPLLGDLPNELFEIKKSTKAKVQRNYHVILGEDRHQYSVPYQNIGKTTIIIYTSKYVEIYDSSHRIAIHKRDRRKNGYSTYANHMPEKHSKYLEQRGWDAPYFCKQADQIGPYTRWAIDQILDSKSLIEQTYNACLGVLSLKKKYSAERVEKACKRAKTTHRVSYRIILNILKNKTDELPLPSQLNIFKTENHENIRGKGNYE